MVVHRRLAEYEGRGAITAWLYGIVRGIAWNRNRRVGRRARHLRALVPAPTSIDPSSETETANAFACFLEQLDPGRRRVFELTELIGMSGREVAECLDINVNTVHTRLRAARKDFRAFAQRLIEEGGSDG